MHRNSSVAKNRPGHCRGPVPKGSHEATVERLVLVLVLVLLLLGAAVGPAKDEFESLGPIQALGSVRDSNAPANPYTTSQWAGMRYPLTDTSSVSNRIEKGAGG